MDHTIPKLDPQFTSAVRRVLDERDAFCPRCGYSLSGLRGARCPECGKNVKEILRVADTTPWRLPHIRRRMIAMYLLRRFGMAAMVLVSFACIGWATWVLAMRGNG